MRACACERAYEHGWVCMGACGGLNMGAEEDIYMGMGARESYKRRIEFCFSFREYLNESKSASIRYE